MLDHYKILGLSWDATEVDIKKAYRKLALKYHPDRNKETGAHDAFIRIIQAYEVLKDPEKRRQYNYLYEKYILQTVYAPMPEETYWKQNVEDAEQEGSKKGEEYAGDYKAFIKEVIKRSLMYLGLEILLTAIFGGEGVGLGFLFGIALPILGGYWGFQMKTPETPLGIVAIIIGILILRSNIKRVMEEVNNEM